MQGLIDLSYTPHLKEILYELSPQSPTRVINLVCGTQVAKSTANLIMIAYRIDCNLRGPILAMHAVKDMAISWAKDELDETIKANRYISEVLEKVGRKNDPYLFKKWPGGSLITRGGASGTSYAKISAAVLLVDDADRFKMNIGGTTSGKDRKIGEGNPLKLLSDRVSGRFGDYKMFVNSSPRAEGESIIWPAFKKTDQNHFYVPCPRCGYMQVWEFENLEIPHKDYTVTDEPYILCQNTDCGEKIYEQHKYKILNRGEYRPTADGIDPLEKGYRISSLYSMLGYPFIQYANDWLAACKTYEETGDDSEKIRHRNSKQARPWKRRAGKTVEHSALYETREPLDPMPEDCVILSAGVDCQDDRLEIQVNGFGQDDTYFIDHFKIDGDPRIKYGETDSPWDILGEALTGRKYKNQWNKEQPIFTMAIDLGFQKDAAKYFIRNVNTLSFQRVFGVFGLPESNKVQINFIKSATKDLDGWESWGLYVNVKKHALYNLFDLHLQDKGHLHFGEDRCFSERWFRQLTVERPDDKGIFRKPHSHARNEALDCCIYAHAAYELCQKDRPGGFDFESFNRWNKEGCGVTARKRSGVISMGEAV